MTDCVERALCLFKKKVGEKDIEVGAFSREKGILYIKIISSLKGSKLDFPLCSTSLTYLVPRVIDKHYILRDITIEKERGEVVEDYDLFFYYSFALDVLMYFGKYDTRKCYDLFETFLTLLLKKEVPLILLSHTIERFFLIQGIEGEYDVCPECGRKYRDDEIIGYCVENGYVCCSDCATRKNVLTPDMRKYLSRTQSLSLDEAVKNTNVDEKKLFMFECFRLKTLPNSNIKGIEEMLKKIR